MDNLSRKIGRGLSCVAERAERLVRAHSYHEANTYGLSTITVGTMWGTLALPGFLWKLIVQDFYFVPPCGCPCGPGAPGGPRCYVPQRYVRARPRPGILDMLFEVLSTIRSLGTIASYDCLSENRFVLYVPQRYVRARPCPAFASPRPGLDPRSGERKGGDEQRGKETNQI